MTGGVAILLALAGLILIIVAVRGTYPDVMAVLATGGVSNGNEPTGGPATIAQGRIIPKEPVKGVTGG